ncbi:MAG: 5'-nucleotidase C-terminal domain-containing protein [Bacteroidales bacterium]|nr:5'-nucleotidase C-terminal domain-containing protein [Bacteroidales bacterium]
MKKSLYILAALLLLSGCKTGMTWEKVAIDGHMTGVTAPTAENVAEAIGVVDSLTGVYTAPNGKVFTEGSTPRVADLLIKAQPAMAEVKEVIAFSTRAMEAHAPESELSNFVADFLRSETAKLVKKPVDFAVTNFGGIRVDMPEGDVTLDDIRSMFPFNNKLCYVELKGEDLLNLLNQMARQRVQCVSGVKMVVNDHKIESLEIGDKPLDPRKYYGVATVDFLLDGGDSLYVAKNARKLIMTDVVIGRAIEAYIRNLTADGKAIEYSTDGRVVVK